MKIFYKNIILFFILSALLVLGIPMLTSQYVKSKGFNNGNTESNLLILNGQKDFDFLFLGNSHARNFSRNNQHKNLETLLDGTVLNFGQGRGICGINDQYFYLKHLLQQGYTFKKVVHVVSPPYLFDDLRNEVTTTFFEEPVSLGFAFQYLLHPAPNKTTRLIHYFKTKWKGSWLKLEPNSSTEKTDRLETIDMAEVEKGFKIAHPNGISEAAFQHNKIILEKCIALAQSKGMNTILLQTPTLFAAWPGQEKFNSYSDSLSVHLKTPHVNLSGAISDPHLFYDHHHLNTAGIKQLLPLLKSSLDEYLITH